MKNIIKYLISGLILLGLLVLSWGFVLYMNWPSLVTLIVFSFVGAIYLGRFFIRRTWMMARARGALATSEQRTSKRFFSKSDSTISLQDKFKKGIQVLKKSSLRRLGNPLYVLPWYMVIGESGSGKTTAITRSRLASTLQKISQTDPITQTVNCDWWYFNKAIVLDTAGRYVSTSSQQEDEYEWVKLLDLLAHYRQDEGINGLVTVISAERLMTIQQDQLAEEGRVLRERIDQLIRLFDKRFPVYVLVTKSDLINGFETWSKHLSEEQLAQAMGYLGQERMGEGGEKDFLDLAMNQVIDRLKDLRLNMSASNIALSPELLMFPAELERLRPGLESFLKSCLGDSPYLEQPLLRGLFFSSAKQTGEVVSRLMKGDLSSAPSHEPTNKGLFLYDFFEQILPRDRSVFLPTVIVNRSRTFVRHLGQIAWVLACVAVGSFVYMSYEKNLEMVNRVVKYYPKDIQVKDDLPQNLVLINNIRHLIDIIFERQQDAFTKWMLFNSNIDNLVLHLQEAFIHNYWESGVVQSLESSYKTLLSDPTSVNYPKAVVGLIREINLLQARVNGAKYEELLKMPGIPEASLALVANTQSVEAISSFNPIHAAFLAWTPNEDNHLQNRLFKFRAKLEEIIKNEPHMDWLLALVDNNPSLQDVTLESFWLPQELQTNNSSAVNVTASMTQEGQREMQGILQELDMALQGNDTYAIQRQLFDKWYETQRYNAWQNFAWSFPSGEKLIVGEPAWRNMMSKLVTTEGPYFSLINRLNSEFKTIDRDLLPNWLGFARDFSTLHREAEQTGSFKKISNFVSSVNLVGGQSIRHSVSSGNFTITAEVQKLLDSASMYQKYLSDFAIANAEAMGGEGKAYQQASDFFSIAVNPATKSSTLNDTYQSFIKFRTSAGYDTPSDQVIWQLVGGPLHALIHYSLEQASCALQKDWDKDVIWRTQMAVNESELSKQLFGPQGSVWAFADGPASPFIKRAGRIFVPTKNLGYSMPFTAGFFPFLNQSVGARVDQLVKEQNAEKAKGKVAKLTITGRPLGVNQGATAKPYAATLKVQCSNGDVTLNNFNFPVTETFSWSPDQCGDVSLQLKVESMTLTKRYPGSMGVVNFIQDFVDGQKSFSPDDFPGAKKKLDALGINTINVRYDFAGHEDLLKMAQAINYQDKLNQPLAQTTPAEHPASRHVLNYVGACWGRSHMDQNPISLPMIIQKEAADAAQQGSIKPSKDIDIPVIPTATSKSPPQPGFYIEIGSYSTTQGLVDIQKQLKGLQLNYQTEIVRHGTVPVTRLLVGPYATKSAASQVKSHLSMLGMAGDVIKR